MTFLIHLQDGNILTGSHWRSIRAESNPLFFGAEQSGTVVLSSDTTISSNWSVSNLTIASGIVLTVNTGKRLMVPGSLVLINNAQIKAGANIFGPGSSSEHASGTGSPSRGGMGGSPAGFIYVGCGILSGAGTISADGFAGLPGSGAAVPNSQLVTVAGGPGSFGFWNGQYTSGVAFINAPGDFLGRGAGMSGVAISRGGTSLYSGIAPFGDDNGLSFWNLMPLNSSPGGGAGGGNGESDISTPSLMQAGGGGGGGAGMGAGGQAGSVAGTTNSGTAGAGGGGGGGGGGLFFLARSFQGTVTTVLSAQGGSGGLGGDPSRSTILGGRGGGGGGGGLICYWAPSALTVNASGGVGGSGGIGGSPADGLNGVAGGNGRSYYLGAFG